MGVAIKTEISLIVPLIKNINSNLNMIQFKAKIKNSNEYITGSSLMKHNDRDDCYVITDEIEWIDGSEWNCRNFEFIDITTLEIYDNRTIK